MSVSINKSTFEFLKELKENNNREWFTRNKDYYQESKDDFRNLVESVIIGIAGFDQTVLELDPKKCLFRIYRDTRFSKDKTPYKINFGAHIIKGGKKTGYAGYYIHVEPGDCFLAGGLYHPSSDRLSRVRKKISKQGKQFLKIINARVFKDTLEIWGDQLKTCPKDFSKDDPMVEYLRYKDLVVLHGVPDNKFLSKDFDKYSAGVFRAMVPFNKFMNSV